VVSPKPPPRADQRIANLTLDERLVVRRSPEVEHERAVAIFDLVEENRFCLVDGQPGPYNLHIRLVESRLVIDVRSQADDPLQEVTLPLTPFRRLIKDYFTVCESYFNAIKTATPSQIEAIDMGRRGLHNEGSELLQERLAGRIEVDFDTARRLFTLVCVLHIRG
jgi:uncharacterized protein (UPF0262 family)